MGPITTITKQVVNTKLTHPFYKATNLAVRLNELHGN